MLEFVLCWRHLQMFSVSAVLGVKASGMEQSWGASAKLPGLRAPTFWSGRGLLNERVTFSELTVLQFVFGVCMGGWEWMCECKFVFTMPFLSADSGPWRRMSRAWPAMSAITTSSGSTCSSHQESAWGADEARQERVIRQIFGKCIVVVQFWSISWTYLQMFSVSSVLEQYWHVRRTRTWSSPEENLPSFLAVAHHHTGLEKDN